MIGHDNKKRMARDKFSLGNFRTRDELLLIGIIGIVAGFLLSSSIGLLKEWMVAS